MLLSKVIPLNRTEGLIFALTEFILFIRLLQAYIAARGRLKFCMYWDKINCVPAKTGKYLRSMR